jgi:hypothetical protein
MSLQKKKLRRFPLDVGIWSIQSDKHLREQYWLGSAWGEILQANPKAESDREKVALALKAIALGLIYLDFCYFAWDEDSEREYVQWAKRLQITPSKLIEMGLVDKTEVMDIEEDDLEYKDVQLRLANEKRDEVFDILCPDPYDFSMIEELAATKDPSEFPEVMGCVSNWFAEKCYQPVEYFD